MKTLFNQRSLGRAAGRAAALCLLALAAIHFQSGEAQAQWTAPDANNNINNTNTSNVGVGTAVPEQKLGVQGMAGFYPQAWVQPRARGMFMGHFGTAASIYAFNYPAGTGDSLSLTGGTLDFGVYPNGGGGSRTQSMTIANDGKVGIGKANPAEALDVVGNIAATGNISAKYQDLAEWVPSKQKLSAGTVVVLDTAHDNHVLASTTSYDTRVAGVISAQPGIALGEAGEGKTLVATTGRVKVRVDATRAPIRIGDLIVTGDQPGVAMRSEPVSVAGISMHRPGTIIGKALEALDKGTGEILVLLSLQ